SEHRPVRPLRRGAGPAAARVQGHAGARPAAWAVPGRHTGRRRGRQLAALASRGGRVPRVDPAVPGAGCVGVRAVGADPEPATSGEAGAAETALSSRVTDTARWRRGTP